MALPGNSAGRRGNDRNSGAGRRAKRAGGLIAGLASQQQHRHQYQGKPCFHASAPFQFPRTIAYVIEIATLAKPKSMTPERAEILALESLGWLAGEDSALERFLNQSGIDAAALRQAAGSPEISMAVLDFLLGNEDLLLQFCQSASIDPKQMHLARHVLGGEM
jgi:hypothetical protein